MNIERLIKIQNEISKKAVIKPYTLKEKFKVAAFDISFSNDLAKGVCIILNEKNEIIEKHTLTLKVKFPYIPTFLAFREIPIMMKLYKKIKVSPDIILIDGNGLIHPRRCGIALHFGVIVNKPTIGVAKSYLYGIYREPPKEKFSYSYVYHQDGDILGVAFRAKEKTKPIFISPGNLMDIDSSVKIIKRFINNYKLPQPLRIAHIISKLI
ncbi:MAG: endonuclease V [Elusimicrobiales bacterium]|nr:endonuclease V [Elusimicrobiales bacterium]